MQNKLILTLLSFLIFSCQDLPDSIGNNNELIIITSKEDRELIEYKIRDNFSSFINTPIEEYKYDISWIIPDDFIKYKFHKNIIILSLKHPEDSTIDLLYNKFKYQYNDLELFSLYNLYSKNQIIMPIGSHNSISLINLIESNKNWINKEIDTNINLNFEKQLFMKAKNDSISAIINNKFSIDAYIDINYKIIDNNDKFLRIGRGMPYRWLIFTKLPGSSILSNSTNEIRAPFAQTIFKEFELLLNQNIEGLSISDYFKVKDGDLYRGLYEHEYSDTGGPFFINMIVDNNTDNEVILVAGFVNNPGKNKYIILKELEVIVKNIRSTTNE